MNVKDKEKHQDFKTSRDFNGLQVTSKDCPGLPDTYGTMRLNETSKDFQT